VSALRLATRGSPLALIQAERVANALVRAHGLEVTTVVVETTGDRRTDEPLSTLGGQGIFVKEVQHALLEGAADLAVHSAKDLPAVTPDELVLCAVPERLDPADVLVGRSLAGLGPGATVATGSPRRRAILAELRPDLSFVELRGNMATRLSRPGTEGIDAVIAAAAALERLGRTDLVVDRLDPTVMIPQVGQGAIAIEAVAGSAAEGLAASISDPTAQRCVSAERSFLATLGAGCQVPVAAWCIEEAGGLLIRAAMVDESTGAVHRLERRGDDPLTLGREVAEELVGR
jgi:hydroxymethylbilane synthase